MERGFTIADDSTLNCPLPVVITCESVLCAQQGLKLHLVLAFAQCLSTLDPEVGPGALSLGHVYVCIFGSLAGSPRVAKAGSILLPTLKSIGLGNGKGGEKQRPCTECFSQVAHSARRGAVRGTAPPLCAHPPVHCWPQSTRCAQEELEEDAGLEPLLLCLGPNHPNWARCKNTSLRYVLGSSA